MPLREIAIVVLAAPMIFYDLGHPSLWADELYTHATTRLMRLQALIENLFYHETANPPLYYLLDHLLFGSSSYSEKSLRYLPAICSWLFIFSGLNMARLPLKNSRQVSIIYMLLIAINWNTLYFAHEARSYSLLLLLTSLSFSTSIVALSANAKKWEIVIAIAVNTLLIYTHYFGSLFLLAFALFLIFLSKDIKDILKKWSFIFVLPGSLLLLWIIPILSAAQRERFWVPFPQWMDLLTLPKYFVGNSWALSLLTYLLIVFGLYKITRSQLPPKEKQVYLISGFVTPAVYVLGYFLSFAVLPLLNQKYMLVTLPPFLLFVAITLSMLSKMPRAIILSLFVFFSVKWTFKDRNFFGQPQKPNMKAIQNVVSLWHQNQPNTPIFGCCYLAEMCNFYFIVQQSPARVKAPLCDLKEFLKPSAPDRFIFFKGQENTDIELLKQKYTLTNEHHEYKSTAYIFEKSSESRPFSQKN